MMAVYTIGDLHLSLSGEKPMNIFGQKWENHAERLKQNFQALTDNDTTVLCGDLSWAMNLSDAVEDFQWIDSLPGKKIVIKGNHDYWWTTMTKMQEFLDKNGFSTIRILNNSCYQAEEVTVCGTRGWFFEEETGSEHDRKIMLREVGRLRASLEAAGEEKRKTVFLHYPPIYGNYRCDEILNLLSEYEVRHCYYGHIHGKGQVAAFNGWRNGTEFRLVSADFLNFDPYKIM